ncbi:MAG: hypothetical protein A4S14_12965 [Proteobacteria bacterium SG_bin9]|nr:MAG: hypothetical protein A4S14_12965 [Proteobacteria bacterium SG_bin9]
MEMHQVKYFLAVCSERNFTRAAKLCNVSQPSLTRGIQMLEAEFGGVLFHREYANTHLTELGEIIRPHLQEVWDKSHAAKAQAQEFTSSGRAKLRLGIMCTIAPALIVHLLKRAREQHDDFELQIVDGSATELQRELLEARLDIAIYCIPGKDPDRRFNYLPLFREQMMIVLPREHRLTARESVRLEDLAGEKFVLRARCEFNEEIQSALAARGVICDLNNSSERDDWALAMVGNGFGFGLFPEHTVKQQRDLIALPLTDPDVWREVNLITVRGRPHSKGVGAFIHETMRARWANEAPLAVQNYQNETTDS